MPTARSVPVPWDPDWAQSLVGLKVQIPSSCWPGYEDDDELNLGVIASIDWTQADRRFFRILVNGYHYYFRYDAVFK